MVLSARVARRQWFLRRHVVLHVYAADQRGKEILQAGGRAGIVADDADGDGGGGRPRHGMDWRTDGRTVV